MPMGSECASVRCPSKVDISCRDEQEVYCNIPKAKIAHQNTVYPLIFCHQENCVVFFFFPDKFHCLVIPCLYSSLPSW